MAMYVTIYILIGLTIFLFLLDMLTNTTMTGEQFISMIPDYETRQYFYNNPMMYRISLTTVVIMLSAFWPITLIYVATHLDDIDKFRRL